MSRSYVVFGKVITLPFTTYIFIDTFKQPVNLFVPRHQLLEVLLSVPALPLIVLGGFLSQQLGEFLGVVFQVADHAVEFQQYHLLQRVGPDIVGFVAGAPIAPVVGAVEILNGAVRVVDVVMQLVATVGAIQQTGEHILLGVLGLPALRLLPELLHLLPCSLVDDGLMVVLKDSPIFFGIVQTALIFEGLGVGLEIDQGARVLPEGQDFGYGGLTPFAGGVLALFAALTDALALPILCGGQDAVLLQQAGRDFDPLPLYAEPVNSADDLGGFIVNDPLPEIVRVFFIAIGRWAHGVASVAAQLFGTSYLAADVLCVPLISQPFIKNDTKKAVHWRSITSGETVKLIISSRCRNSNPTIIFGGRHHERIQTENP